MDGNYTAITEEYGTWLNTLGFSKQVVYNYPNHLQDFFAWLQTKNITTVNRITQRHITDYFGYLQTRPNKRRKGHVLSASTLNDYYIAVDKLCEFLHQTGMDTAPVPTGLRMAIDKDERVNNIQPLTIEEIKALQANIGNTYGNLPFRQREQKQEELKLIFALYYGCGLRRTEGYKLTVNDIDLEKKTIFIRQGKNYKDRIIPMNPGVCKALEDYIYNFRNLQKLKHKRLFISTTGTLNSSLQHLGKLTNIDKRITLHILRHSIATHLLQAGMGIENIALFLGHSSLESTQIYTHLA